MTEQQALQKIDPKDHAACHALAQAGFSWDAISQLAQLAMKYTPELLLIIKEMLDVFTQQAKAAGGPAPKQGGGVACPEGAKHSLCEARKAALQALACVVCAQTHLECCD